MQDLLSRYTIREVILVSLISCLLREWVADGGRADSVPLDDEISAASLLTRDKQH